MKVSKEKFAPKKLSKKLCKIFKNDNFHQKAWVFQIKSPPILMIQRGSNMAESAPTKESTHDDPRCPQTFFSKIFV